MVTLRAVSLSSLLGVLLLMSTFAISAASSRSLLDDVKMQPAVKHSKAGVPPAASRVIVTLSKAAAASVATSSGTDEAVSSALNFASVAGATGMTVLPRIGTVVFDTNDVAATTASLLSSSNFVAVEADFEVYMSDFFPDDPSYNQLWGMGRIRAPAAWDTTTGDRDVVVCVIDTGVDYTHPDLSNNMWRNAGETGLDTNGTDKATNGIDDDGNGYVDDVYGINAITGSGDPMDDHYHGTHCAGTVGAEGNNGIGVAGVSHEVSIMGCKFLSSSGSGYISHALACVDYAVMMGAPITSNSWGGGGYSQTFFNALSFATQSGQLFVAAAGNSAVDNDLQDYYPSNYSPAVDAVMSVAALDQSDNLSYFSQWGATTVDLAAPGSGVFSTMPGSSYGSLSGTSMATPHVAGAAALLLAHQPELTNMQVKSMLLSTAAPLASLAGRIVSGGVLDVATAVTGAPGGLPTPTAGAPYESFSSSGAFADLLGTKVTFSPRQSDDEEYEVCVSDAAEFIYDPSEGSAIALGDDDHETVAFTSGFSFLFYGTTYSSVHVGSNGYLTFVTPDTTYTASVSNHHSQPRVSALYTDLTPDSVSAIRTQQLPDRFVVTYSNIKQYGTDNRHDFQVILHAEGAVELVFLRVETSTAMIVGLSKGGLGSSINLDADACSGTTTPAPTTPAPTTPAPTTPAPTTASPTPAPTTPAPTTPAPTTPAPTTPAPTTPAPTTPAPTTPAPTTPAPTTASPTPTPTTASPTPPPTTPAPTTPAPTTAAPTPEPTTPTPTTPAPTTASPTPSPTTPAPTTPAPTTAAPTPEPTTAAPTPAPTVPAAVPVVCPSNDPIQITWLEEGFEATCRDDTHFAVVCSDAFAVLRSQEGVVATCQGTVLEIRNSTEPVVGCAQDLYYSHGFRDRDGSDEIFGWSSGGPYPCQTAEPFQVALDTCSAMGSRLCSLDEISAKEARSTGCNLDSELIWSADQCTTTDGQEGFMTAKGLSGASPACQPMSSGLAGVRCCADTCKSESSCSDMGDAFQMSSQGTGVVCASVEPTGTCQEGTHLEAREVCENQGARLCTLWDIRQKEITGLGCDFSSAEARVWSSQPCTTEDGVEGFTAASASGAAVRSDCLPADWTAPIACCADA